MVRQFNSVLGAIQQEWLRGKLLLRYRRVDERPAPRHRATGRTLRHAHPTHGARYAWLDHKDPARRHIDFTREWALTLLGLTVTLAATGFLCRDLAWAIRDSWRAGLVFRSAAQSLLGAIFLFLIYGNVLYQLTRLGYFLRLRRHRPAADESLDRLYDQPAPRVTMLIPSYREELAVIEQSLFSTALQEYPRRRIVLLIDDPHAPAAPADARALEQARALPRRIRRCLAQPHARLGQERAAFEARREAGALDLMAEIETLRKLLLEVAAWFRTLGQEFPRDSHADRLFVDLTFNRRAVLEEERGHALASRLILLADDDLTRQALRREYARLASLFEAEITTFERKRYANLSHAPNKAMNLNSYIGLIGGRFAEVRRDDGWHLVPADPAQATLRVPATDFVLTLDADSLLDPSYTLRLVHVMQQPQHARTAVIQTPYSAVPDAPGLLERIAGATTDIQYLIHQGFTACRATFWVGANALLRKRALDEIMTTAIERGHPIRKYIQDRTVIEDTESSIDLILRRWRLHNYPERLSYSATPPDFGSLLIQRRRWANGGLLILPKLLQYLVRPHGWRHALEGFMRLHYLTSILGVNLGVLFILMYPLEKHLNILWLPLTAAPYYLLYGRDLVLAGYRLTDLCRVYALNLLLIPVNLGGVLKSLHQAVTGQTIPFSRTPKIAGRTMVPPKYIFFELLLLAYCLAGAAVDGWHGRWLHACFALLNAGILGYAFWRFIGLAEGLQDLRGPARPAAPAQ